MKIKQLPEDFLVEEIPSFAIKEHGSYQVFLLEKKGLDTFGAKRILGKEFKVSNAEMGIAGLKDRHAVTRQYISFPSRYRIPTAWSEQSLSLEKKGFLDDPICLGQFLANRFTITVRDIKEGESSEIFDRAREVLNIGVPNYFDSQRFGSLRGASSFIAKHLIQGNAEAALKVLLTSATRNDPAQVRRARIAIKNQWGKWTACAASCKESPRARRELRIILHLVKNPSDFIGAFFLVEKELQKLYIAAYQSFLWNETIKVLLVRHHPALSLKSVPYQAGELLIPKEAPKEAIKIWTGLPVPLLNPDLDIQDEQADEKMNEQLKFAALHVLKKERLGLEQLKIPHSKDLVFKQGSRLMWVVPKFISIPVISKDELNSAPKTQRYKLTVSFELPPGAYATMVLKAMGVAKKGRR